MFQICSDFKNYPDVLPNGNISGIGFSPEEWTIPIIKSNIKKIVMGINHGLFANLFLNDIIKAEFSGINYFGCLKSLSLVSILYCILI